MNKIGLIDADLLDNGTRHPNLALMKIAAYYQEKGYFVELIKSYADVEGYKEIFISKVFSFTNVPSEILEMENVHIGGTGFFEDGGENLPDEIEHHMPYYNLYNDYIKEEISRGINKNKFNDYLNYSIGFTTRGCFRKCAFCVNKKYNEVFEHSPVSEFLDDSRPYIYLWDDNILAFSNWREIIHQLEETGKQFQFRQGIDLRLMNDEKAKVFNNVKYQGDFIFAFDHIKDSEIISKKVQLWKRYTSKTCKMYVLSGFDSQDEYDIESVFKRIKILMKYGSLPYIMRYEDYKLSKYRNMYIELARWCNQPNFFKKKSFREFCILNQEYKKNKMTNCSSYQAMIDFEKDFPEISKKYFDLKFEEENIYNKQYGYGRKYANKPECSNCKIKGQCIDTLINNKENDKILMLYFTKEIDLLCLNYKNSECEISQSEASNYILNLIKITSISKIINLMEKSEDREKVTKDNILQFSNLNFALYKVIEILSHFENEKLSFEEIGYYLMKDNSPDKKKELALKKYGENHTKLAALLDLVHITKTNNNSEIFITEFGKLINELSQNEKKEIVYKLFLRIPVIQNYFIKNTNMETIERDLTILSKETKARRMPNVLTVIREIEKYFYSK